VENRLLSDQNCSLLFSQYKGEFEQIKRANDALYKYQKMIIEGDLAGRQLDEFRVFMERNAQLLNYTGLTGVVVPSAFHSNAGAAGVRRLYLQQMSLQFCFSFENAGGLFDIHRSFKFAVVVALRKGPTADFLCAFYLHDDEWLFDVTRRSSSLVYPLNYVKNTGGEYLTFLELKNSKDFDIAKQLFSVGQRFGEYSFRHGIRLQKQPVALDMTKEARKFKEITDGSLIFPPTY
jgi:hypothetical protein